MDGNKRSAMMAITAFLGFNGWRLTFSNDQFYDLAMAVATGELDDVVEIAAQLKTEER
ncbi:MAG: hypothetical protein J2O48_01705 [Solirubrobacterales bacterium]|nr:hypothetical protein [Solirubrobacterales bacterium]